jgi:uncharacterized protein YjbI with pentapeptide repeats
MTRLVSICVLIALSLVWYGFQNQRTEAMSTSQTITDFTGADLTGANLSGVSLDGVILCNTTMPDGTINNTSCKN